MRKLLILSALTVLAAGPGCSSSPSMSSCGSICGSSTSGSSWWRPRTWFSHPQPQAECCDSYSGGQAGYMGGPMMGGPMMGASMMGAPVMQGDGGCCQ